MDALHYRFFYGQVLIGSSALEYAVPSMGIRSGFFHPENGYATLEPLRQEISSIANEVNNARSDSEWRSTLEQQLEQLRERYRSIVFRAETCEGEFVPISWIDILDFASVPDVSGKTDDTMRQIYLCG
jgi:hypothetical protein